MEPQTGGLEDDFPFSKGWFSGSMLVFGVVFLYPYPYIGKWSSLRSIFFQMGWDHQLDNICPPGAVVVFFFALISKAVFYELLGDVQAGGRGITLSSSPKESAAMSKLIGTGDPKAPQAASTLTDLFFGGSQLADPSGNCFFLGGSLRFVQKRFFCGFAVHKFTPLNFQILSPPVPLLGSLQEEKRHFTRKNDMFFFWIQVPLIRSMWRVYLPIRPIHLIDVYGIYVGEYNHIWKLKSN